MKKSELRIVAFVALCLTDLSACSRIKSYFPDKEKDYHYSQEIPPLELPSDLMPGNSGLEMLSASEPRQATIQSIDKADQEGSDGSGMEAQQQESTESIADIEIEGSEALQTDVKVADQPISDLEQMNQPDTDFFAPLQEGLYPPGMDVEIAEVAEVEESSAQPEQVDSDAGQGQQTEPAKSLPVVDKVRYMVFDDGSSRIQIDAPLDKAWRLVGKAISHNSIEITARHRAQNHYIVQYQADEQVYQDGSLWDEVLFFFGEDQKREKEFRIKLLDGESFTEVFITDENEVPQFEGEGERLLQLLFRTIKANLEEE